MYKNKALITAISLTPKTELILKRLQNSSGKNRSEIVRNLIDSHSKSAPIGESAVHFGPEDTNKILKYHYQIFSSPDRRPVMVIGVAIVSRSGKVLIGLRKAPDQHVKNLSWTFPSGKFFSLDFEKEMLKTVRQETGLTAKILRLVHARLIPDSPAKKVRIVAVYYHCKILPGKPKSGGDFKQIKWVPADDVTKYFTTSTSDEVMNFLGTL